MYCVPYKEIKTVDAETIVVGENVAFKYGSSSYEGEVLFISGKLFCFITFNPH